MWSSTFEGIMDEEEHRLRCSPFVLRVQMMVTHTWVAGSEWKAQFCENFLKVFPGGWACGWCRAAAMQRLRSSYARVGLALGTVLTAQLLWVWATLTACLWG